jgi:hypothetical protein
MTTKQTQTPLRDWSTGSYDPMTGRAASSTRAAGTSSSHDGLHVSPSPQIPRDRGERGAPGCAENDRHRTQGPRSAREKFQRD